MKIITIPIFLIFIFNSVISIAQTDSVRRVEVNMSDPSVLEYDENIDHKAMQKYLYSNLKYPMQAINNGIEGTVYAQFTITPDGQIINEKIISGIGAGCDEEVLRIIKLFPNLLTRQGKKDEIRSEYVITLPVKFVLMDDN